MNRFVIPQRNLVHRVAMNSATFSSFGLSNVSLKPFAPQTFRSPFAFQPKRIGFQMRTESTKKEAPKKTKELKPVDPNQLSFAKALFFGKLSQRAFPYPLTLNAEQQETLKMLISPVEKFFEKVDSKKIDETKEIPTEVMTGLKELGLFGLQIPENHGGLGLSNTGYARIVQEIVSDGSLAVTLMAHQSIGLKGILLNGNEEQKAKYLPKLATGEHIAAFCLTEPSSGSDAGSIRTTATLSPDGKHFLLNGGKIWISNGGWAEIMTVFAKTKIDGEDKVTAFIVERSFGGITNGAPEDKLGIRGSNTCAVYFENTPVPLENVLGEVGGGFKVAMNILNNGRFGLGAGAGAMLKKLIAMTAEHATTRTQFGKTLSQFKIIKEKFAIMELNAYAIESMAFMTTAMIDRGDPSCEIEAAMCKVFGSEVGWTGVNECIQVMGGMGFMKDYPYERIMRDTRILSIFEGTNEILRLMIALTGIKNVGDSLKSYKGVGGGLSFLFKKFTKSFSEEPIKDVAKELRPFLVVLQSATKKFGSVVEAAIMKHKKGIVDEQIILKRIADIAIDLFATAAVISRCSKSITDKSESSAHELLLTQSFIRLAVQRISANLRGIESGASTDVVLEAIADQIFKEKKYIPKHPLGF